MIENSVLSAIEQFSLLDASKNITVALSGGADSVALIYALYRLREKLGITLSAAHLNHMIRGEEALRDEEFVKKLCKKYEIPLFCERTDVPAFAKIQGLSLETAAREVRYGFLERVNCGVIATAHTASDNLETVLFNLSRGTALKGLCGIPPKRGIFIRPLILASRSEIEDYCKKNNLDFVTDSTNLSDDYTRNRIRHTAVPILKSVNPSAEKAAARACISLSEDEDFLTAAAEEYLLRNTVNGALKITDFHPAVLKRAIKRFAELLLNGARLDSLHINEIYSLKEGGRVSLPCGSTALLRNGLLYIIKNSDNIIENKQYYVKTETRVNDLFTEGEKVNNLLLKNSLDCDKIVGKSVIRTRQSGDSIRLAGRGCTKTLKKLMNELKIPENVRNSVPVIADDRGVVWVYGAGAAQRCAVNKKTEKVMVITVSVEQNKTD